MFVSRVSHPRVRFHFLFLFFVPLVARSNPQIDLPDSDRNISRIYEHYDEDLIVTTSALAEIFLRKVN